MATSTDLMHRFLEALGAYESFVDKYAILYADLVYDEQPEEVSNALLNSLERHVQAQRIKILTNHWGDLATATPGMAEEVIVPHQIMSRVTSTVGFYGIPRTALFLYVHAYLLHVLFGVKALEAMDEIIDELDPR